MTAGLVKIAAGEDGYEYLTRQVAANDATSLQKSLGDYYMEKGESPGRWLGSGLAVLSGEHGFGVEAGSQVREEQMQALFGSGRHPEADRIEQMVLEQGGSKAAALKASQLGRVFSIGQSGEFQKELAEAYRDWNLERGRTSRARIPEDVRAGLRTQVALKLFRVRFEREPLTRQELDGFLKEQLRGKEGRSCAGFDMTFTPVKSVSALWAVAPREVSQVVEQAHREAVEDTLGWMESQAAYTRRGMCGARQVETAGLMAAAFVHRDSRAGDPNLHTHVAISNKVQAREDGAWLALDGRMMYQLTVAASERYNSMVERLLTQRLGVEWVARASESGRRQIREIAGVPEVLIQGWSKRRVAISERTAALVSDFEVAHGRTPTPTEKLALAQRATLETRQAKHEPRSLYEQRQVWRQEAAELLGSEAQVDQMAAGVIGHRHQIVEVDDALIAKTADRVVEVVEAGRATWQIQHILAETQRQTRVLGIAADRHEEVVNRIVEAAVGRCVSVGQSIEDRTVLPEVLTRSDGGSTYQRAHSQRYTSVRVLEAEQFIASSARATDGAVAKESAVDIALLESVANNVTLNAAQKNLVREFATSGARVQLALAPAGTGKTTAMGVLASAWRNGGGNLVAVAPTHIAVDELRDRMGCAGGTIAALTHAIREGSEVPDWAREIDSATLVVVDEAGMAGTFELAGLIAYSLERGASVRLIGDNQQLAAVAAGGVLRDLAECGEVPVVRLDEVVRFIDPAESRASLELREGNAEALGFYLDHDRLHTVAEDTAIETLVEAWRTDTARGWKSIMLAATNEQASELNTLARQHLVATGVVDDGESVMLSDGNRAGVGDIVVTRVNDRRLRFAANDWVKNRDRWRVQQIHGDGSLSVKGERHGRVTRLPAEYVRESLDLGYAGTVHAAQGVTVDTTHTLIVGTETRQSLYVALSRGSRSNHVWVSSGAAEESDIWMETLEPPTPVEVLTGILGRDGQAMSATTETRLLDDPFTQLHQAATIWQDGICEAFATLAGPDVVAAVTEHVNQVLEGADEMRGWYELRTQLLAAHVRGDDPIQLFDAAVAAGDLADARNPVAVVSWRLRRHHRLDLRGGGPLPSLWSLPDGVELPPEWHNYLNARRHQVTAMAAAIRSRVTDSGYQVPKWMSRFTNHPQLAAELAVYRASVGVPDADESPTGPKAQFVHERAWQKQLKRDVEAVLHTKDAAFDVPQAVTEDPFWEVVATRLQQLKIDGKQVDRHVVAALARGPLPVEHPASALWYRLVKYHGYHEPAPELRQPKAVPAAPQPLDGQIALHQSDPVIEDQALREEPPAPEPEPTSTSRDRIIEVNQLAAEFFAQEFVGSSAQAYLTSRLGTDLADRPEVVVGYAPPGNALMQHLQGLGVTDQELLDAGLAKQGRKGLYATFRERLIFGLHDQAGDLVGFVGRAAPGADPRVPKYLNTPTTRVFRKGEILFGMPEYQQQIIQGADLVRTEGVLDALAITLASDGQAVGVAPLGTALTPQQAEAITTTGARIWEAVDHDKAGQKALTRDYQLLSATTPLIYDLAFTTLDGNPVKDPAELYAQPGGREAIRAALAEPKATVLERVITQRLHDARQTIDHPHCQLDLARETAVAIAQLPEALHARHINAFNATLTQLAPDARTETISEELAQHRHQQVITSTQPGDLNHLLNPEYQTTPLVPVVELGSTSRERIVELNELAAAFFTREFVGSSAASYLISRLGTDLSDRPEVMVGYAPPGNVLTDHLKVLGATDQELLDAGLTADHFDDHLVIGLHSQNGDLVGFTGYPLNGDTSPVTTPATRAFDPQQVIFGAFENRRQLSEGVDQVRVEDPLEALYMTAATNGQAVGIAPATPALTGEQATMIANHGGVVWEARADKTRAFAQADNAELLAVGVTARQLVLLPPPGDSRPVESLTDLHARPGGLERIQQAFLLGGSAPDLPAQVLSDLVRAHRDHLEQGDPQLRVAVIDQIATQLADLPPERRSELTELAGEALHNIDPNLHPSTIEDALRARTEQIIQHRPDASLTSAPTREQVNAEALDRARTILTKLRRTHETDTPREDRIDQRHQPTADPNSLHQPSSQPQPWRSGRESWSR